PHHHALHSFPTRRSSDLTRSKTAEWFVWTIPHPIFSRWHSNSISQTRSSGRSFFHPPIGLLRHRDGPQKNKKQRPEPHIPDGRKDRKSTRLNSSHVKISY